MDSVKQGAFQALVATASDKSDTVKDTLMYLVQKAGILFGFSAVTLYVLASKLLSHLSTYSVLVLKYVLKCLVPCGLISIFFSMYLNLWVFLYSTMFGYALLNFPAAARPFVYMHWVRLPWLKFEEPSVRACFGFFHGILRTKYIAIQSPLNGITVRIRAHEVAYHFLSPSFFTFALNDLTFSSCISSFSSLFFLHYHVNRFLLGLRLPNHTPIKTSPCWKKTHSLRVWCLLLSKQRHVKMINCCAIPLLDRRICFHVMNAPLSFTFTEIARIEVSLTVWISTIFFPLSHFQPRKQLRSPHLRVKVGLED